ncbi:MAG TPA: glycoside hydrolase family 9 protein [Bacteroidia bacterium]|jgi:hypothetical protein|nr:glycoside hydrolase family 9 protein [Bacteroidia bacterium]
MKYFHTLTLLSLFITGALFSQATFTSQIRIDQVGYRTTDKKMAVVSDPQVGFNASVSYTPSSTLEVHVYSSNALVYSGPCAAWNGGATNTQSGDKAWWFDFSSVTAPGEYVIYDPANGVESFPFHISDDVYDNALRCALRTYYFQRCGIAKQMPYSGNANYTDVVCHHGALQDLDCRAVTNPVAGTSKDLSGGWHDAGDYNKYVNFTLATMNYLMDAYEQNPTAFDDANNIPESGNGVPDILDEAKWELDWLLKMQLSDGSELMKVSTAGFTGGTPPSTETAQRFYGAAQSSSTRTAACVFAHAAIVFKAQPSALMQAYGDTLLAHALLAWTWLQNNPGYSNYTNSGFSSANPEVSHYDQDATSFSAAVYLYAATNNTTYRTFVDANYTNLQPYQWTYWYPFESVYQNAMLYYTTTPGASPGTVNAIRNNCANSVTNNNVDLLPAYLANTDPYLAYMKDQDYVWNNNQFKAETGSIYANMNRYNIYAASAADFRDASLGYLHYFHGVNVFGSCFLSNANAFGGDRFTMQIYHGWFGDGTIYDSTANYLGPPPGYLVCGVDYYFAPDAAYTGPPIAPPMNQPVQKSYKDWNTSWPENSWQCSEVGIYTEAAYIKLLSTYCNAPIATSVYQYEENSAWDIYPNPAAYEMSINSTVPGTLLIYNSIGEKTVQQHIVEGVNRVDISELAPGIYFCSFSSKGELLETKKLMIVR